MDRQELTQEIIARKETLDLSWADIAGKVGKSTVWTTAALLGQMSMTEDQARAACEALNLNNEAPALLQKVPMRGSLDQAVPTDALIYRFYEIVQVYGTTLKAVIEDEFGDGIMSAIDVSMDVERVPDPAGDRVKVTMNGKFLPYRQY